MRRPNGNNRSVLLYDSINVYVPINGLLAFGKVEIVMLSPMDRFITKVLMEALMKMVRVIKSYRWFRCCKTILYTAVNTLMLIKLLTLGCVIMLLFESS